nr:hypothetical protein [Tanacetum cinerariifolium]
MLAICKVEFPVEHKAPNTSSYTRKKDSKGKKPRAKSRHRKQPTSSKHHLLSNIEATKGCDALGDSTVEVDLGIYAPNDIIPQQQGMDEGTKNNLFDHIFAGKEASDIAKNIETEFQKEIKLEDLSRLVQDQKIELEKNKFEAEVAFVIAQPSYPNVAYLTELLVKSLQPELLKILSTHYFHSSLPTELKELPSKFNDLTEEVERLKKHVHELEIKLPGDLKEIPNKLETFTSIVKSITTQITKLKTLQWKLPAEFLSVPTQVETVQAKIKTLDALLSFLNKVTKALNKFAQAITSKSKITKDSSGEHIKKDKGKKAMSSKDAKEEGSDSKSDDIIHLTGSRAHKRLKSSVQYEDHPVGTVLNEPVLGMIMFNSYHRQDFIIIKDFGDFPNEMTYTVQEIFLILHQGPGLDDHARTFRSLLLVEIDKRNLNPLKQMTIIE